MLLLGWANAKKRAGNVINDQRLRDARLLVVDDEEVNLLLLERILQKGGYHDIHSTSDPSEAVARFREIQPDLVLTDLHMTGMDGLQLIRQLQKEIPADSYLPIIMLTADMSPEAEGRALQLGAKDFINKPFKAPQIQLRVRNLLQTRFLHLELQSQNDLLEERVKERTIELEAARHDILERLALAAEYRDHSTGQHTQRVGRRSELLALKLGFKREDAELLRRAATLHDVGKIGVPDSILLKPGRLTPEEHEIIKRHVKIGVKLLSHGQSQLIRLAEVVALTHHERWDGSGYPRGLKGDSIPLVGQIVAISDVFDTLVSARPYKEAWPLHKAVAEIKAQRGKWFGPRIVDRFLEVIEEEAQPTAAKS